MIIDAKFYMHESDRAALEALQAIPGFTPFFKAFMKVFNEKQFYWQNMSSNLRLSERQLPKYYNMLPPICEKLGIEVPELYLEQDGSPNAYTFGDTKPFIVITSGLLRIMPEELIPTVLAHECGHIACRHSLYTTMGRVILSEAAAILGLTDLVKLPLQMAFSYWMRRSELSADRAAALCDGSAENVVKMCMCFSGVDKQLYDQADYQEFLLQAREYQANSDQNMLDKTLEYLNNYDRSHPLNAVRALECWDWAATPRFDHILNFLNTPALPEGQGLSVCLKELPMEESSRYYVGKETGDVIGQLQKMGFQNVTAVRSMLWKNGVTAGRVCTIYVDGREGFEKYEWLPVAGDIRVEYYGPETEAEIAAAHPGQLRVPNSSRYYLANGRNHALFDFGRAGFTRITTECVRRTKKGLFDTEGSVIRITVNGQANFERGEWFPADSAVCITYVTYLA